MTIINELRRNLCIAMLREELNYLCTDEKIYVLLCGGKMSVRCRGCRKLN